MPPISLMTRPVNWLISASVAITLAASMWSDDCLLGVVIPLIALLLPMVQPLRIIANERKRIVSQEIYNLMSEIKEIDRQLAREAILAISGSETINPRLEAIYLLQTECKRRGFLINSFICQTDAAIYYKLQSLIKQ